MLLVVVIAILTIVAWSVAFRHRRSDQDSEEEFFFIPTRKTDSPPPLEKPSRKNRLMR